MLAGGSTPLALYRALADRHAGDARWQLWYGDERCLPLAHPERNSVMAETAWLAASRIPPEYRRPIPAERGAREAGERRAHAGVRAGEDAVDDTRVRVRVDEHVVLRDADVVEADRRGIGRFDPELVLEPLDRDAGMVARDDERLDRRPAEGLVQELRRPEDGREVEHARAIPGSGIRVPVRRRGSGRRR